MQISREGEKQLGMKTVNVVAAIIVREDKIFATQRGYGEYKDWWEFPGGKVQEGETSQEALKREIHEELGAEIDVGRLIDTVEYDYPEFHLSMKCYWCEVVEGKLELLEHEAASWLSADQLYDVEWLPADKILIPMIKDEMLKWK